VNTHVNRQISNPIIHYWQSPIGWIEITSVQLPEGSWSLSSLYFRDDAQLMPKSTKSAATSDSDHFVSRVINQLDDYFNGRRSHFNIPLSLSGTTFQLNVWHALQDIPYGSTISYQQLANTLHRHRAVRAVGAANGKNPISIIIPCHRVIGSNGHLTGYAGGLHRKAWLLKHEGVITD
jgi:methylated-DNA-[protein]-cysteine S-methyltransferase